MNKATYRKFNIMSCLYTSANTKQFWNRVKRIRKAGPEQDVISLKTLSDHYTNKFSTNGSEKQDNIANAKAEVDCKYRDIKDSAMTDFVFTSFNMTKYITKLKCGCSPGSDGIMVEHLKYSNNSELILHLCALLTICFRFGVVPDSFTKGILVPILKKPQADPALASNYRPIIISTVFSKLAELYILEQCDEHSFSDLQFGFIGGRGTCMAASLAEDVTNHCVNRSSPVFLCSLDAQGAFDSLPHAILFQKASGIIPDISWRLLHYWYTNQHVFIRWNGSTSDKIPIQVGTRQGGLTSCYLFNIFYQDMIHELNVTPGGLKINNVSYCVFCYADDVLLASTTATGLQCLIDCAVKYVSKNGLCFNPVKTNCLIKGKCPFERNPVWMIDGTILSIKREINYLGSHTWR
jgi:hypothetical protein